MLNSKKLVYFIFILCAYLSSTESDQYNKIFLTESINQNGITASSNDDSSGVSAGISFNIELSAELSLYVPIPDTIPNPVAYVVLTIGFGSGDEASGGLTTKVTKRLKQTLNGDAKLIDFNLGAALSQIPILDQLKDFKASILFQLVPTTSSLDLKTVEGKFDVDINTSLQFRKKVTVLGVSAWANVAFKLPQMSVKATAEKATQLPIDFVEDDLNPEEVTTKKTTETEKGKGNGENEGKGKDDKGYLKYVIFGVICAIVVIVVIVVMTPKNNKLNLKEGSGESEKESVSKGFTKPNAEEKGKLKESSK